MHDDSVMMHAYAYYLLQEAAMKFDANTSAIVNKLYKKFEDRLSSTAGKKAYLNCISKFIEDRYANLYDTLPCSRIFFGDEDVKKFFDAIQIPKEEVTRVIAETYYGPEPNFSPKAVKDEFTIAMMCVVRFFLLKNMSKELELAIIHLCFSGKFYPSLHYRSYPTTVPVRHVMEYTVNNRLNTKFDLISEGSILGAIRKIGTTWATTYKTRFKSFKDEDIVYCVSQLYSRIGSFMKNIATEYYKVYDDKDDLYIAYASDNYDSDDYHIADSDILKLSKITEKSVNYITSNGVNAAICKQCSDDNITTKEISSIVESILSDPENVLKVKRLISLLITAYFMVSEEKDVRSISFLTYSIAAKPNSKQPEILEIRTLVEELLSENSPAYIRRKSRIATKNSFERALIMYFALSIHNANR